MILHWRTEERQLDVKKLLLCNYDIFQFENQLWDDHF